MVGHADTEGNSFSRWTAIHSDGSENNSNQRRNGPVCRPFVKICKWKMTSIALQPMHYFIIQNTAVMAWWSQQVATQLPGFLNRFVRRMIQCFHKGEAASVSLTVISLSLPAFVLMSSFYIHCKLITFLNHHQAHGSLLWLLFILDCKMNCVFYIYIYMLSFISASFLPSSFLWFW